MKRSIKKTLAILAAGTLIASSAAFTACDQLDGILEGLGLKNEPQHVHAWTEWKRTATEHDRRCLTCGEEEHGTHSAEQKCPDCGAHFKVLAFGYVEGGDTAHADFAVEANEWFTKMGEEYFFTYEHSVSYDALNDEDLADCDLVMFLNGAPGGASQQDAFRRYVENGGACMIYHSAAFAMWDNHVPPSDWYDWYHNELLRSGEYGNRPYEDGSGAYWNTWDPTMDYMLVENTEHFATANMELDENNEFLSSYCEWYAWANDLMNDPETTVLITLNPTPERPAGNNPEKASEIWTSGHHPIAWANNNYKMIYMNWGHNLQSYNHFEKESRTFDCEAQNQFMLDGMFGLVMGE